MGTEYKLGLNTPIISFYRRRSVFITGVTGFVGTVLIEKLLYTCRDIKNVYVLIKPKQGLNSKERLEILLKSPAFDRLREQNPEALKKIIPLKGDLVKDHLDFNEDDAKELQENVSVVFHVAANVNFNLPLADVININARGTENVLKFCRNMIFLKAFVYVSTAYSNCRKNHFVVEEKIYNMSTSIKSILYAIEHSTTGDKYVVNNLLQGRINEYSFSKAVAEQLIQKEFSDLPIAIVRPSIITSSVKDPVVGWVEGSNGASTIIFLQGNRILRAWCANPDVVVDLIPADYVANNLIAAAWDIYTNCKSGVNEIKVFNCCSGLQNPLTIKTFLHTASDHSKKHYNYEWSVPPTICITKHPILYAILSFIFHTIPAYIIKGLFCLLQRKSRIADIYRKMLTVEKPLIFFSSNQFTFIDENVLKLYEKMDEEDQKIFNFNVKDIDWHTYIEKYVIGLKEQYSRKFKIPKGEQNF